MAIASATGIASGIPTDQIISQLLALRQKPISQLQDRISGFQSQQGAYVTVNNALLQLMTAAKSVSSVDGFRARSISTTNTAALGVTATTKAAAGSYAVNVLQLATAHRVGAQGFVDTNTTAVAAGAGVFKFKIGVAGTEKSIALTGTTTLADLREAINASDAGVSASIINDGSATNPYRLVLTSKKTGAANEIIVTQNDTSLNFTTPSIEAATAKTGNTFTGTATSSGTYTGTSSKRFVVEVTEAGATGAAKFRLSTDGGVTFGPAGAFTTSGTPVALGDGVEIAFSAGTFAVGDRFEIDAVNPKIDPAQDAVLNINGVTLTRDTNTVTDAIEGVSFNLLQTTTSAATVTVSQDTNSIRGKIVSFVTQYNAVIDQVAQATAFDATSKIRGPLLGDSAVRAVRATLARVISSQVPGLGNGSTNSIAGIGITVGKDGKLTVDNAKLDKALSSDLGTVEKLFATAGGSTAASLEFVSAGAATKPGTYAVNILQAAEQAQIQSAQDVTGPLDNAETLTFTVGTKSHAITVAAGLSLSQAVDSINAQLTAKGLSIKAEANGNKLRLFTDAYGSASTIKVRSNQDGSSGTQLGIGTTDLSDTGVDVSGQIGGRLAKGNGQSLTGVTGSANDGLVINYTGSTTGFIGNVTVSTGVGVQIESTLNQLTDGESGLLPSKQKGVGDSIAGLNKQIETMQARIVTEEARLRAQFSSLETTISSMNSTSQFLTNQLSQLAALAQRNGT